MADARFNVFWYLSLLAPALIMLVATAWRRQWIWISGALLSLGVTYWLCVLAVIRKWDIRWELAVTDAQRQWVGDHDGGNLTGTALLLAPIEAVIYTTLWGIVGWWLAKHVASRRVV